MIRIAIITAILWMACTPVQAQEEEGDNVAVTEEVVIDLKKEDIAPSDSAPETVRSLFFSEEELAKDNPSREDKPSGE